jgi:hypothetical protein
MYVNNTDLTPPQAVLDKCHCVFISDPAFVMWRMKKWCRENGLSLLWSDRVDTADVGGSTYDEVAAFWFIDARDATAFTLKFK